MASSREREQAEVAEPIPGDLHPALLEGLRGAGIDTLWAHQGDALEAGPLGARHRDHRHGERQVARLQPSRARHARGRPWRTGLLPLPDQGARPGPGPRARADRRALAAARDLRRRHAARRAPGDPRALQPDPHEPGHAAHRGAPQPRLVGRPASQPRLGRGRRGPRVPRRVRVARGECAASPAPVGPRLRLRAPLPPHERHDRQPARAGRAPDRGRGGTRRPRRRPARRAQHRDVESATRRRTARPPRVGALRGGQAARRARGAGGAHDLLPQVAARRRADPALRPRAARGRRPRGPRRTDRPLPGRLHPDAAPRDRAPPGGGGAARRGRHRRARASASTLASSTRPSA